MLKCVEHDRKQRGIDSEKTGRRRRAPQKTPTLCQGHVLLSQAFDTGRQTDRTDRSFGQTSQKHVEYFNIFNMLFQIIFLINSCGYWALVYIYF